MGLGKCFGQKDKASSFFDVLDLHRNPPLISQGDECIITGRYTQKAALFTLAGCTSYIELFYFHFLSLHVLFGNFLPFKKPPRRMLDSSDICVLNYDVITVFALVTQVVMYSMKIPAYAKI